MSLQLLVLRISGPEQWLALPAVEGDGVERERGEWVGDGGTHGVEDGFYNGGVVVFEVIELVVGFAPLLEHLSSGNEAQDFGVFSQF